MRKVRIDRSKWRSGGYSDVQTGAGKTQLLNEEGYRCCLGFASCQLSKKPLSVFENIYNPSDLDFLISPLNIRDKEDNYYCDSNFSEEAIDINDNPVSTREEKEELLTQLFARNDLTLEFFGEYENV